MSKIVFVKSPFVLGLWISLLVIGVMGSSTAVRAEGFAPPAETGQRSSPRVSQGLVREVKHRLQGDFRREKEDVQILMFRAKVVGTFTLKMDADTTIEVSQLKHDGDQLSFQYQVVVKCSQWDIHAVACTEKCVIPARIEGPLPLSEVTCTTLASPQSIALKIPASPADFKSELQSQVLLSLLEAEIKPVEGLNLEIPFANTVESFCAGTKAAFVERVTGISLADESRREVIAKEIAEHVVSLVSPVRPE